MLNSGSKTAIVTNTTVEIIVPENVIGSVYGENGTNLTRLRQVYLNFAITILVYWNYFVLYVSLDSQKLNEIFAFK